MSQLFYKPIDARHNSPDQTHVAGQQFQYTFDTIGNRTATGGRASAQSQYSPKRLNQYSQRTVPGVADILGIANPTVAGKASVNDNAIFQRDPPEKSGVASRQLALAP